MHSSIDTGCKKTIGQLEGLNTLMRGDTTGGHQDLFPVIQRQRDLAVLAKQEVAAVGGAKNHDIRTLLKT